MAKMAKIGLFSLKKRFFGKTDGIPLEIDIYTLKTIHLYHHHPIGDRCIKFIFCFFFYKFL